MHGLSCKFIVFLAFISFVKPDDDETFIVNLNEALEVEGLKEFPQLEAAVHHIRATLAEDFNNTCSSM